jgi:uncharacterized protein (DUF2267 family)
VTSRQEAARLTASTLETLGERLYRTEREQVAAQLPDELKPSLHKRARDQNTRQDVERFPLEAFYHRVSARADVDHQHAITGAQAVMQVVRSAVSAGAWNDMVARLPGSYDELTSSE